MAPRRFPLETEGEWLAIGQKGWAVWHHPDSSSVAFIRFESFGPVWMIGEVRFVRLDISYRLQANDLRLLALGRVQSMASDPDIKALLDAGRSSEALPVLDPSQGSVRSIVDACERLPERPRASSLAISVPPKGQRDMYFYDILETVYRRAASQSSHPAKDIAEANGVPVTTVHSWLKAMRKVRAEQAQQAATVAVGLAAINQLVKQLPDEPIGSLTFVEETLDDGSIQLSVQTEPPKES
ncbi:MAG: hypothetical protein JWM89_4050 [Acidimicrobiales bacterium]|nr:hypothetical protein [Acidimicrobiales bacterium]